MVFFSDPVSAAHWTRVNGDQISGHDETIDYMLGYWQELHKDGKKPGRTDIRPYDFRQCLPHIALLDVLDTHPFDVRIRLAGSEVSYYYGNITGALMSQLKSRESSERALSTCEKVATEKIPWLNMAPSIDQDRQYLTILSLYCPLFCADNRVQTILSTVVVSHKRMDIMRKSSGGRSLKGGQ